MKWKTDYRSPALEHKESMPSHIRLGSNLKSIMHARGVSLKKLSEATSIPYSTLHMWLDNRQPKDILKVRALSEYLAVDMTELLFGDVAGVSSQNDLPNVDTLEGIYEVVIRRRSPL